MMGRGSTSFFVVVLVVTRDTADTTSAATASATL